MKPTDPLSEHFTLAEMARTSVRPLAASNLEAAGDHVEPLTALCQTILEPIRERFGPVIIHSGYRSPSLNTTIGGSKTSQHMKGEAADFEVAGHTLEEVWDWIGKSDLPYGQCLLEGYAAGEAGWIHISLGEPWRPREKSRQHFRLTQKAP